MQYTTEQEKKKVRLAFNAFLASKGYSLRRLTTENNLSHISVWQKMNRGDIQHDYVNELVSLIDPCSSLQKLGESFYIGKK